MSAGAAPEAPLLEVRDLGHRYGPAGRGGRGGRGAASSQAPAVLEGLSFFVRLCAEVGRLIRSRRTVGVS